MPVTTATTGVRSSPYLDAAAGGKWGPHNTKSWGQFPAFTWNQDAAALPPHTQDRMAVRNASRDSSWKRGCCDGSEQRYMTEHTSWPYSYRGATGYGGATVHGERVKSGTHTGGPSLLNDAAWTEQYSFTNLGMLGGAT